jgi:excisionase family DNA binding protein
MTSSLLDGGAPFTFQSFIEELGLSDRTGRRLLPKIGYCKVGGLIRIPRENVERYLASRYVPPAEPAPPRRRATGQPLGELVDGAVQRARGGKR